MNIYTIITKKLSDVLKKMLELDIKFYASISMVQQLKQGYV